jgi:hypothetical protein
MGDHLGKRSHASGDHGASRKEVSADGRVVEAYPGAFFRMSTLLMDGRGETCSDCLNAALTSGE